MKQIIVFYFPVHIRSCKLYFWMFLGFFFRVQKIFLKLFLTWIVLSFEIILELDMLKGLINFLTEVMKNLRLRLTILVKLIKNRTVSGLFYFITIIRRLITFFSCQGNSLFLLEHTLDFLVIKMPKSIKIFAKYSKNWLFKYFGNIAMKLVILRKRFNFTRVLMSRILSFEKFLIIIVAHFLF
jgi:hypothetical protein